MKYSVKQRAPLHLTFITDQIALTEYPSPQAAFILDPKEVRHIAICSEVTQATARPIEP